MTDSKKQKATPLNDDALDKVQGGSKLVGDDVGILRGTTNFAESGKKGEMN